MVAKDAQTGGGVAVLEEAPSFVLGVLGRLVLLRTRTAMQPEAVQALFRQTTATMAAYGPLVLYVVMPGAMQPRVDPEAQRAIASLWPKIQAQSAAGAVWIRARGFNATLHRDQLAALLPYLRDRSAFGVTESAAQTLRFFGEHVPDLELGPDAAEALEAFARRYD